MLLWSFHRQRDQEQQEIFQCAVPAGWGWNEQQFGAGKKAREITAILLFLLTNGQYLDIFPTSTQMSSSIPCTAPTRLCLSYCQNLWVNKEHRNTHTKKYNIYMFFPPPKWPQDFWRSATLCSFANNIKTPRVLK